MTVMPSGHLALSLLPPNLSKQPPKQVAFATQTDESQSEWGQLPTVIQQSPPSMGDDGGQNEWREEEVNISRRLKV